jgi:hypothetical protein
MQITRKHIFILLALTIVIALIAGGYLYHLHNTRPALSAFKAIPGDAAVIFQTHDAGQFWSTLSASDLWKEMSHIDAMQAISLTLASLDSTIRTDENSTAINGPHRVLFTVTLSEEHNPEILFLVESTDLGQAARIKRYIHHLTTGSPMELMNYKGKSIYSVKPVGFPSVFYFTFYKGLFAGSLQPDPVVRAVEQAASGHWLDQDTAFSELIQAAGKNAVASVFFNNRLLPSLFKLLVSQSDSIQFSLLEHFAGWSEFDLKINNREWLLNGFTSTATDRKDFLSLFNNQGAENFAITGILPFQTSFFIDYTFNDADAFMNGFRTFLMDHDLQLPWQQMMDTILSLKQVDLAKEMQAWDIEETGLAVIDSRNNPSISGTIFIMRIKNRDECLRDIRMLSDTGWELKSESGKTVTVPGFTVMKMDVKVPFSFFFRPLAVSFSPQYYIILGNTIIFSGQSAILNEIASQYRYRRTLANDVNYARFYGQIAETSNIYIYLNIHKVAALAEKYATPRLREIFRENGELFRKIEGLSIQYSSLDDLFYSNIYLKYNPDLSEDDSYTWEADLDTVIYSGPFLIQKADGEGLDVICSDQAGNLYRIDATGMIRWKVKAGGTILSEVYSIRTGHDKELFYLYNTSEHLFMLDTNGIVAAGYPVILPSPATNGMILTGSESLAGLRMIYAGEDDRLHAIDIKGKPITGWGNPNLGNRLSVPAMHLTVKKEEQWIAALDDGGVVIAGSKGKVLYRTPSGFVHARNTGFYVNRTNSKGSIITTDAQGNLVYLPGKTIGTVNFGNFSPDHYFLYQDFNGDGDPDFIFVDGHDLSVFNRLKKLLFSFTFEGTVKDQPVVFTSQGKKTVLGVVTRDDNRVYLFNQSGLMSDSQLIRGNTPFTMGPLSADTVIDLVIGRGNKVLDYWLEGF